MNAKKEFQQEIGSRRVLCATVYTNGNQKNLLPVNYTDQQYAQFLESLNFEYDARYGSQELFGTIWYLDGTWSERGEYDGSEWWECQERPEIEKELQGEILASTFLIHAYQQPELLAKIPTTFLIEKMQIKGFDIGEIINFFNLLERKQFVLCLNLIR